MTRRMTRSKHLSLIFPSICTYETRSRVESSQMREKDLLKASSKRIPLKLSSFCSGWDSSSISCSVKMSVEFEDWEISKIVLRVMDFGAWRSLELKSPKNRSASNSGKKKLSCRYSIFLEYFLPLRVCFAVDPLWLLWAPGCDGTISKPGDADSPSLTKVEKKQVAKY